MMLAISIFSYIDLPVVVVRFL